MQGGCGVCQKKEQVQKLAKQIKQLQQQYISNTVYNIDTTKTIVNFQC